MDPHCKACDLHNTRTNIVHGEGSENARIMFIGEAPGRLEDEIGRPFVGRSGKLLRTIMKESGINPDGVFITNVVKCRPPDNRTPRSVEVRTCLPNLIEELYRIDPDLVVFVGRTSAQGVTKMNFNMEKDSGSVFVWKDWYCMIIYHPGWIIRALSVRRPILEREMRSIASMNKHKEPRGLVKWI